MRVACPKCHLMLESEQINVATDVAFCPTCNEGFRLSECLDSPKADNSVVDSPPNGAWISEDFQGAIVGASTRSPVAFFLVPFMCVWSGGSIGGIYGTQIASGKFDLTMSLFGIPFLLGTLLFGSIALMAVCGKVVVKLSRENSSIFLGVGSIGWTRRFNWSEMDKISETPSNVQYPGGQGVGITLEGKTRIKFGTNLSEKRRYFMLNALKSLKGRF